MISLDQILLLEQKVESAVAKIAQLNAENAALRSKCAELTNALSAKSEQFTSFQADQNKIEEGILKALDRLNTVESSILENKNTSNSAATVPASDNITEISADNTEVSIQPQSEQVLSQETDISTPADIDSQTPPADNQEQLDIF